jgi:uncharacterized protein
MSSLSPRSAFTSIFALLLSTACGGAETSGEQGVVDASWIDESSMEQRGRPQPADYTQAELEALAQTPAVVSLNGPFADAPPPSRSLHVTMPDGTRRAVSLYFPAAFDTASSRAPVVYIEAWYGRGVEATATAIELYRGAGFVVAISDLRGVGASFGALPAFMTPEVRQEQREMIAWLAAQPWSNGKVAAEGFSISATYAEAMAASGAPALKAAIIRASDFDQYANNVFPGGVPNPRMMGLITKITTWMRGEPCIAELGVCPILGLPPVDADTDFSLLQAALVEHQTNVRGESLLTTVYKDDPFGSGSVDSMSPAGSVEELRRAAIPARVSASWLDGATGQSALERFNALPDVPMEVVIGASAHSGGVDADPFSRTPFQAARPPASEQYAADVAFLQRVLAGEPVARSVSYYVLGAGVWKSTEHWPPAGVQDRVLRLSRHGLVEGHRWVEAGEQSYTVDPTTSSGGPFNRWGSQGGEPVYYGDRRAAPGRRLAFDSSPVERDMELVGAPELCLALRSDQTDGVVFAYLEDVAPSGRVTHLTEGQLRLIHRKTQSDPKHGCDPRPGTLRSFKRADSTQVTPGELMYLELPLLPTAALIRKGHRVRLALAGADAGTFPMLTETASKWRVTHGGRGGSSLRFSARPWSAP